MYLLKCIFLHIYAFVCKFNKENDSFFIKNFDNCLFFINFAFEMLNLFN